MSYKILLYTINMLLILHFLCDKIVGQEKSIVTFKKISTIEGNEKNFIGRPADIIAYGDLVYFADALDMKIKIFTLEGNFVRSFGNRGRGPGEFQHFTKIWLNQDNNIVVVDFMNSKMVFLNLEGKLLDEKIFDSGKIQWPRYFEKVNNTKTLVKYSKKPEPKKIFHIWDKNFNSVEYEFSLPEDLNYDDLVKKMSLPIHLGATTILNGKLFHAPFFYEGKIYVTDLSEDDISFEWNVFDGYTSKEPSYTQLGYNEPLKNESQENTYDYNTHFGGRSVAYRLNSGTKSLFATVEGYIAHIFEVKDGTQKKQGIQIFSSNGELLGHTFYNTKPIRNDTYTLIQEEPKTIDEKNRVYTVVISQGGTLKINVYQLRIKK